jgi:DNA-directed RNA polymerase subunit M/transcription elongation factor TFIIS
MFASSFISLCRYNSSLDEYRLEDSDERARIRRAIEIQEGIEIDQVSGDLVESLASLNSQSSDDSQEHCRRCQQNEMQYRQLQQALLTGAEDENNPKYHSQVNIRSALCCHDS